MKDRMEQLQEEMQRELDSLREQHETETRRLKEIIERLQRGSS
jgi:MerR family transcriptional regulator/heat shock protein HspR